MGYLTKTNVLKAANLVTTYQNNAHTWADFFGDVTQLIINVQ